MNHDLLIFDCLVQYPFYRMRVLSYGITHITFGASSAIINYLSYLMPCVKTQYLNTTISTHSHSSQQVHMVPYQTTSSYSSVLDDNGRSLYDQDKVIGKKLLEPS